MTVSSETSRITFAGNGSTTSFATSPMVFFTSADLDVTVVTTATGAVVKTLVVNTDFTISGGAVGGVPGTGTLNLAAGSSPYGAPATGTTLVIVRDLVITQATDFVQNDSSDANVQEAALDRLTMVQQEIDGTLARSLQIPSTDVAGLTTTLPVAGTRANKALTFDASGNVLMATLSGQAVSFIPTTEFFSGTGAQTAFTLAQAVVANAMIVDIDGVKQKPGTDYTVSGTTLTFTTAPASGTNNITVQSFGFAASVGTVSVDNVVGLAASTGASKVGFAQSGSGPSSTAQSVQDKLRQIVNVLDAPFGAIGDGVTDDIAAFDAAMASLPAAGGIVYADAPNKTWKFASTLTIPSKVTLVLGAGTHVAVGAPGIAVTVGTAGASGRLTGHGSESILSYTGSGYAVDAFTGNGGQSSALVDVRDLVIVGTSSGLAGVRFKAFNGGTLSNVESRGFTTGSGYFLEGANAVTIFNPNVYGNLHGLRNVAVTVNAVAYSVNSAKVFGGQIRDNTGWGLFEDGSQSVASGPNIGNLYTGVVFETNGVNGSTTTGNVFIQQGTNIKLIGNYLEYGGGVIPASNIVIGDGTYAVKGTQILGNTLLSSIATNSISNVNGTNTQITGNEESGAVTNFINNGAASLGLFVGPNTAGAAGTYVAGSDTGADSIIFNSGGTQVNALGRTIRGLGFNVISGLNQDLIIRARGGGANTLLFADINGNNIGSLGLTGKLNTADKLYPGTDAAAAQSVSGIYAGNGVPNNANGTDGDYYLRGDGTAAGNTCIYHRQAGAWVALVTT